MNTGLSGHCNKDIPVPPGIAPVLQKSQKLRVLLYPYPGYLWHARTELTEVPGTDMNVVQNPNKLFVRVWMWSGVNHAKFHQRKFSGGELWATDEQARPLPSL